MDGEQKLIQGNTQENQANELSNRWGNQGQLRSNDSSVGIESDLKLFENLKWLTSREAVDYLRLPSVGALRQLVYRRRIPFAKMGRNLRFNRLELDRFLESSTHPKRRSA
jgi:excisionase family DNA binding protein